MLLSSLGSMQRHLSLKILEQRHSWLLAGALPDPLLAGGEGWSLAFLTSLVQRHMCMSFDS